MGKDKDFSVFIKSGHVLHCFFPVLFIPILKHSGKNGKITLTLSIMSGLFVAATMVTSLSFSTPSISVSSWARTRSPTLLPPDELKHNI